MIHLYHKHIQILALLSNSSTHSHVFHIFAVKHYFTFSTGPTDYHFLLFFQTTSLSTITLASRLWTPRRRAPLWPTAWTTWLRKVTVSSESSSHRKTLKERECSRLFVSSEDNVVTFKPKTSLCVFSFCPLLLLLFLLFLLFCDFKMPLHQGWPAPTGMVISLLSPPHLLFFFLFSVNTTLLAVLRCIC